MNHRRPADWHQPRWSARFSFHRGLESFANYPDQSPSRNADRSTHLLQFARSVTNRVLPLNRIGSTSALMSNRASTDLGCCALSVWPLIARYDFNKNSQCREFGPESFEPDARAAGLSICRGAL